MVLLQDWLIVYHVQLEDIRMNWARVLVKIVRRGINAFGAQQRILIATKILHVFLKQ